MPSSSYSSGFSSRALISSNLNASVGTRGSISSLRNPERSELMPYEVPPLPYDYDALEPHIDEQTMHLHHDKHHQAYVDKANGALEGTEWADAPVEDVLRSLDRLPDSIRTV